MIETWHSWYLGNVKRFHYPPVAVNEADTYGNCTFVLDGITPRIRFVVYADGCGADVYVLNHDGEIWDYLLWLDHPGGASEHTVIADSFNRFLKWANALHQVDRIELIETADHSVRDTRVVSPLNPNGRRETLRYNWESECFQPWSRNDQHWILHEDIRVHL